MELQILAGLFLGGTLGVIGQSIRVVAGLKKMVETGAEFKPAILLVSLLIGFVAGSLAYLGAGLVGDIQLTTQALLGLVAAGYAGTDFIEAFMKKQT